MQRFFVQLPRQVHPRLGRIDVFVEIQHEIVGDDAVAGGEERDQAFDQMPVGGRQFVLQIVEIDTEIDLLHRPRIADGVAVHLVERGVTHRSQREREAGVEQMLGHCEILSLPRVRGRVGVGECGWENTVETGEMRCFVYPHPNLPPRCGGRSKS